MPRLMVASLAVLWLGLPGCGGSSDMELGADGGAELPSLTVIAENRGGGSGVVHITPVGGTPSTCAAATCTVALAPGSAVELVAQPGANARFDGWTGACTGPAPCALVMDASKTVGASFVPAHTLTVTRAGRGQGTVTSADLGIDCGADCSQDYADGTMVVLTATPVAGHDFGGFTPVGVCSATTADTCSVTMDAARSVTATFTVTGVDLIIETLDCTPDSLEIDSPWSPLLTCQAVVSNLGDSSAPTTTVELRGWSARSDVGELSLGSCAVPAIAAHGAATVSCARDWRLQPWPGYGPSQIVGVVDPGGTVVEASDDNNRATEALFIFAYGPELVPTDMTCSPASGPPGTSVSCALTIVNAGSLDLVAPFSGIASSIELSAVKAPAVPAPSIGTCTTLQQSLLPGTGVAVTCTGVIPAGGGTLQYIGVEINADAQAYERTDANNRASRPFVITRPGAIDLEVVALDCTDLAVPGGSVSCTAEVRNLGALGAPPSSLALVLGPLPTVGTSDLLLATCAIPALAAGASATATCLGALPASTLPSKPWLGVLADSAGVINEANESNNRLSAALVVGPDLVPVSLSCLPARVAPGDRQTCTAEVRNAGSQPAPAFIAGLRWSATLPIDAADPLVGSCAAPALAPGETQTITCDAVVPSPAAVGNYAVALVLDTDSTVTEADEDNNWRTDVAHVGPNLLLTSATCTPRPVLRNQLLSCTLGLANDGGQASGAGFRVELRLANVLVATCSSAALAARATSTVTCADVVPAAVPTGSFQPLEVVIDGDGAVTEFDESDNQRTVELVRVD